MSARYSSEAGYEDAYDAESFELEDDEIEGNNSGQSNVDAPTIDGADEHEGGGSTSATPSAPQPTGLDDAARASGNSVLSPLEHSAQDDADNAHLGHHPSRSSYGGDAAGPPAATYLEQQAMATPSSGSQPWGTDHPSHTGSSPGTHSVAVARMHSSASAAAGAAATTSPPPADEAASASGVSQGSPGASGSPGSPPLPPLNPTVSPWLDRSSGGQTIAAHPMQPLAPYAPPPPQGPPVPAPTSTAAASHATLGSVHPSPTVRFAQATAAPAPVTASFGAPQHAAAPTSHAQPHAATATAAMAASSILVQAQEVSQQERQRLAAAIRQSVEYARAADQIQQLQERLEVLTQQLLHASRARDAADAALVEQAQRAQEVEKRLAEQCEAKLLEKQKEIEQLRTKIQQLEAQGVKARLAATSAQRGSGPAGQSSAAASGLPAISPEEATALRKEMDEQESLIRAYQQENMTAMRRIKELEESVAHAEVRVAEEALRGERHALQVRDDVGRRNADTAAKLTRVLQLEQELQAVKEQAEQRELEMRAQLDKVRGEKKALEARSGGVDLRAMADGDVLVKRLQEEMAASNQATHKLVEEMQAKLAWYAENQDLLNRNDQLVAEQRAAIQQLQAKLAQYEGGGGRARGKAGPHSSGGGAPPAPAGPASAARVRELEAQVDQLQQAMRSRAPGNSLAAVIAAAKPTAEESQLIGGLRTRVEELEEDLRAKDEEFEMQLRTYQQQFEKLKVQYAERATRVDAATKVRGRVKELERQLEDQKAIFARRIRELEAKLKAAQDAAQARGAAIPPTPDAAPTPIGGPASAMQTPIKGGAAGGGQPGPGKGGGAADPHQQQQQQGRRDDLVPAATLRARDAEMKKLQADLERRSKQVSELHLQLSEAESKILRLSKTAEARRSQAAAQSPLQSRARNDGLAHDDRPVGSSGNGAGPYDGAPNADLLQALEERCSNLTVESGALRQQVASLTRQVAALQQELDEARRAPQAVGASRSEQADAATTVPDLRRKLEASEMALTTVQRAATEAIERAALASAEHQRSLLRLHDEVAYKEGLKWQERLSTLEQELRLAHQRCEQLEADLAVARSRAAGGWAPEATQFLALERRLDEMAREQAAREAKWRAVLEDTRNMYGVQTDAMRRKWEGALAAKEMEVQRSRAELTALLVEAREVQELQAQAAAAVQLRQSRAATVRQS